MYSWTLFLIKPQEMRRQANLESDSDSDHNDEQVEEDGATYEGEFGLSVENLKVFCVSATDYLKLKGKLPKDGPPQVMANSAVSVLLEPLISMKQRAPII